MSSCSFRPYLEAGNVVDVSVVGYGGKTTFMNSFLGVKDSDIDREGTRAIEINGKRIVVRMTSHEDYFHNVKGEIGFVVCKLTDAVTRNTVEPLVELLRRRNIQNIFIIATYGDKAKDRLINQNDLKVLAESLKVQGAIEVNSLDKKDLRAAVNEVIVSVVSKKPSEKPAIEAEPVKAATSENERINEIREEKLSPVQEAKDPKINKKTVVKLGKPSVFWSWFLNLFSCFGIFYTVVEADKKKDITPPDVNDF